MIFNVVVIAIRDSAFSSATVVASFACWLIRLSRASSHVAAFALLKPHATMAEFVGPMFVRTKIEMVQR